MTTQISEGVAVYSIQATLATEATDALGITWRGMIQIPTFALNPNVQGILSESAAIEVARRILDPLGAHGDRLTVDAAKVWIS